MKTKINLRWVLVGLSIVGLLVSLYLLWIKIYPQDPFCTGFGDCEAVNLSVYSTVRGIPVALFGALAYAAILLILLFENRIAILHEWGTVAVFGLSFAGTLYSLYLTYIELFVIYKVCPYCVTSAVVIALICVISGVVLAKRWKETE